MVGRGSSNICGHQGARIMQGGRLLLTFSGITSGRVVEINYLSVGMNLLNQLPHVEFVFFFN